MEYRIDVVHNHGSRNLVGCFNREFYTNDNWTNRLVKSMYEHGWLLGFDARAALWLAFVAASAGLALACRWRLTQRSMRYRALRMLGYARPATRAIPTGFRYAAITAVAVVTVFVLTPVSSGISDDAPSSSLVPTELAPTVIIVEIGIETGVTVVVQKDGVEIRPVPLATPSDHLGTAASQTVHAITTTDAITIPVTVLPADME